MMGIPGNRFPAIKHKAVEPKPNSYKVLRIANSSEPDHFSVTSMLFISFPILSNHEACRASYFLQGKQK